MVKTGVAFGDYISTGGKRKLRDFEKDQGSTRNFFLIFSLLAVLVLVIFKLFSLQILQGDYYRGLANSNRIKTVVIHAPRGQIFDRNGKPLVFNVPGFRKTVDGKTTLVDKTTAITLLARGEKNLEFDSLREYPYKEDFAHVLGYTGQISEEELKQDKFSSNRGGDLVGKMGVEQYFENFLRGEDGKQLIEVDSLGNTIRKLGETDPIPGQNITLNLDLNLQRAGFDALNVERGAIIVSNPKGEILSLISKPSFDPNLFTLPNPPQKALEEVLFDSEGRPLLNRAISGTYPPGSTFKLVVAAAGLTNKLIDENYEVEDRGVISVGAFSFSNWYFTGYGKTEGAVNVVKGIKRSNDIFFYKLAELVGVSKVSEMAEKFGLGKTLGIDLFGEEEGLVPTPSWKQKEIGEPWYLGDTYHYGIGQGYLLTTPLQVNAWTQAIANEGKLYRPHLLKNEKEKVLSENFLDKKTVDLIRQGMIESCATGGVAWPFFDFKAKGKPIEVACKTGTAQHGGETTLPHAWITLFAPAYNPQIIVTVLAEESGEGSNVAAPVAKKILEEWFGR